MSNDTDDEHARVRVYDEDKQRITDLKRGDDTQADVVRRQLDHPLSDVNDRVAERFEEARKRTGGDVPAMDASTFLSALLDTQESAKNGGYTDVQFPEDVRDQLDRIEARAEEATTAAQNAEASADDLKGAMNR